MYLQQKYEPPSFTVRLAHKDFTLGMDLAKELGVPMKQVEVAFAAFDEAMQSGLGDKDARYEAVLQVMDELRAQGVQKVGLQVKTSQ